MRYQEEQLEKAERVEEQKPHPALRIYMMYRVWYTVNAQYNDSDRTPKETYKNVYSGFYCMYLLSPRQ